MVDSLTGSEDMRHRLAEMGFVRGGKVRMLYTAPAGTPIIYELLGTHVALRRREAEKVMATRQPGLTQEEEGERSAACHTPFPTPPRHGESLVHECGGCTLCGSHRESRETKKGGSGAVRIALVGNPNCGKTSLFNAASGGHERVGNYSGVTVHSVVGETTFEGRRLQLVDLPGTYSLHAFSPEEAYVWRELRSGNVDVVINVIDVNNLERNLLLTLQVRRLGIPMVAALNIYDEFEAGGSSLDTEALSRRTGIPLVPTVARTRRGIDELLRAAIDAADNQKPAPAVPEHYHTADDPADDPCESDSEEARYTGGLDFGYIRTLVGDIYNKEESPAVRITRRIDKVLASRWMAYPIFAIILWLIFWLTFAVGQYPMDWIDRGVSVLSDFIALHLPDGWLSDMLTAGILGGVGSVIIFLPNILILYFLMSAMEDSGYLARAALLTDPGLSRIGLHGKSFIPLLMGFGCNVPAIMATRTIESNKSRMLTMMVVPLMSCSARIPVYTAFAGAFFFRHASVVMLGLYALGVATALMVAAILNRLILRSQESHFVMELPTYRLPEWRGVMAHTWQKGKQYLHKMGGIILVSSIVIWALGYFPRGGDTLTPAQQQEQSYMGQIGRFIEPAIRPLGYDWRMGVGIVAGVGAKELMVSTLGVLYGCSEEEAGEGSDLEEGGPTRLQQLIARHTTPAAALAYMVFALLYFPCLATVAAVRGETGRLRVAAFIAIYTTALAYVAAFITYNLAQLL